MNKNQFNRVLNEARCKERKTIIKKTWEKAAAIDILEINQEKISLNVTLHFWSEKMLRW